jgi:hypothetical protein
MQPLNSQPTLPTERRAHPRTPCSQLCRIAPYRGGAGLRDRNFELVQLNDISAGGFSYWATRWPQDSELAFVLTDRPTAAVFLSQVRHLRPMAGRFIVGCQIIRLLSNSAAMRTADRRWARIVPDYRTSVRSHRSVTSRNRLERSRLKNAGSGQTILPNCEGAQTASLAATTGSLSVWPDELLTLLQSQIPSEGNGA